MRLISQDGMTDVNYDNGSLTIGVGMYEEYVLAIISYYDHSCQKGTKLAEYSSKSKALKAMEMLRKEYLETVYDYRTKPKVFQFPKDEDVEVCEWEQLKQNGVVHILVCVLAVGL